MLVAWKQTTERLTMAYARWSGKSDVYFLETFDGTFRCMGCTDGIINRRQAIAHLQAHMAAGDRVPQYAIDRLQEEWDAVAKSK